MSLRRPVQVGMGILSTIVTQATSKILAKLGDVRGATDSEDAEWWQHVGFASRPSLSVKGSATAAQAVVVQGGDRDTCIASQDARGVELYGILKEGETSVYAAGPEGLGQARSLWKADGSVTHFTKEANLKAGDSIYSRVATGLDNRGIPDGFTWSGPWGTSKFDHSGFHVVHRSGACLDMGGIGGLPPPLDVIGSYVKLKAATVHIEATSTSHGVGPLFDPLAKSTATGLALTALQVQVTALGVAIGLIQAHLVAITTLPIVLGPLILALPTFGVCTAPCAAVVGLCAAGLAGNGALCLTIPSSTSSD